MRRLTRIVFLIIAFAMAPHNSVAAAPGEVIISHASMSTTSIPLWVTQRQNFFGKYGIKSKVVWVRGNPAQIATLVSGDTQIAYGGAPTAIAATLGGRDMKIIASLSSRESLDIVARPNIKSAKELAGKRFGVQSVGGGVWKTATVWLEHLGMDERRDNIQMIVIGDVTVLAQSLEAGLIDATVVPGYLSRRLATKGFTVLGRCEETRLALGRHDGFGRAPLLAAKRRDSAKRHDGAHRRHALHRPPKKQTRRPGNPHQAIQNDRQRRRRRRLPRRRHACAIGRRPQALCLARRHAHPAAPAGAAKPENRQPQSRKPDRHTIVKKIEDSGFFEKMNAEYGGR